MPRGAGYEYEIRVQGRLTDSLLAAFEGMRASVEPVETVLHGPVQDQAALYGLLDQIQSLGLELVEVRRLPEPPEEPEITPPRVRTGHPTGRTMDNRRRQRAEGGEQMAHLVVLGLDNREDAERVMDLAGDLAKQHLLELEDVAYAYRDDQGKVRIHQAVSLTGAGAASGALWGTLIGMLFLMPVAGLAIGAGTGALAGKLSDVGINDDTIRRIGEQLQQGKAAVFLLARSATADRVIEAIKPFNPTVIQTSLSHDREEELVRALQS